MIKDIVMVLICAAVLAVIAPNVISSEREYTDVFCAHVNGDTRHTFDDRTRPDCINTEYAIEVDWATGPKTYEGVGQALHYATMADKTPGLVLILKTPTDIRFALRAKNIHVHPKIKIWTIDTDHNIVEIN